MINKALIFKYLPWLLLLITVNSHGQTLVLGSTFFWWIVQFFIILFVYLIKNKYSSLKHQMNLNILGWYIYYVFLQFIFGAFISVNYWDWKYLISNTMCLYIPMIAFASNSKSLLKHFFTHYIFYTAPLFLLFQFFIGRDEYGFYLAPFSFFILFFPVLTSRWKIILFIIAVYVIFADFGARSNLIKFILPFIFCIIYYFRNIFTIKVLGFIRILLFLAPFIFLALATSGIFNIFNPKGEKRKEFIEIKRDFKGELVEDDLTADTRTFLYLEVLQSTKLYNSWIFGRSPARGNFSDNFGEGDLSKRNERNGNEVSILNYFVWLGLVGVFLIFLIFFQATYLAIYHSNNMIIKIIGTFIAFRWAFAWVEDINNFYIQYIYLWIFIGLCFSENFRKMTDKDMKVWIRSIFDTSFYSNTRHNHGISKI
jgi:hypothetical protein